MREFVTAVQDATTTPEEVDAGIPFKIDNRECRAYKPEAAQFAVLMAQTGRHVSKETQTAGIINFFMGILDEEDAAYITDRLLDRKDKFGLKEIQDIMEWLIEEWTARPTESPSGSTTPPSSTGL